jgi:hypothetical protein
LVKSTRRWTEWGESTIERDWIRHL